MLKNGKGYTVTWFKKRRKWVSCYRRSLLKCTHTGKDETHSAPSKASSARSWSHVVELLAKRVPQKLSQTSQVLLSPVVTLYNLVVRLYYQRYSILMPLTIENSSRYPTKAPPLLTSTHGARRCSVHWQRRKAPIILQL